MISLRSLLAEAEYSFGCAMLYFSFPEMKRIHDMIATNDVFEEPNGDTYGLEVHPHATLLYGLHDGVSKHQVESVLDDYTYSSCRLHNPSTFSSEFYDVLKFDVKGANLNETNKALGKLPHTTKFPDYHPHMTIAYLTPGTGKKYIDILNQINFNEFQATPQYAIYSVPDGQEYRINIKLD